jgi:hypothetical protein
MPRTTHLVSACIHKMTGICLRTVSHGFCFHLNFVTLWMPTICENLNCCMPPFTRFLRSICVKPASEVRQAWLLDTGKGPEGGTRPAAAYIASLLGTLGRYHILNGG